jgi:hypothetical protein
LSGKFQSVGAAGHDTGEFAGKTGFVGINKRAPSYALEVYGTAKTTSMWVNGGLVANIYSNGVRLHADALWKSDSVTLYNGFNMHASNAYSVAVAGGFTNSSIIGGGLASEGWRRFRISVDGGHWFGTGTHALDQLLWLGSRSNLIMSASLTVSNNVTVTGNLQAPKVLIGSSTNGLAVVGTNLLWITGTTTQKVTLGSYP